MIESKFNILGLELKKQTPTVAEWSSKWGEESIRTEATNNVWYRSTAPEVRDLFLHGQDEEKNEDGSVKVPARKGVDELTGIPRLTKTVTLQSKNPDGSAKTSEAWDETEQKYFNRVCGELVKLGKFPDSDAARLSFQPLIQECADLVDFDASRPAPGERKAKGIAKVFLEAAKSAVDKGNGTKLAKALSKSLGRPIGTKDASGTTVVTVEELAAALKADDEQYRAKRAQELAALVNG
jgi:hypothetical protein